LLGTGRFPGGIGPFVSITEVIWQRAGGEPRIASGSSRCKHLQTALIAESGVVGGEVRMWSSIL